MHESCEVEAATTLRPSSWRKAASVRAERARALEVAAHRLEAAEQPEHEAARAVVVAHLLDDLLAARDRLGDRERPVERGDRVLGRRAVALALVARPARVLDRSFGGRGRVAVAARGPVRPREQPVRLREPDVVAASRGRPGSRPRRGARPRPGSSPPSRGSRRAAGPGRRAPGAAARRSRPRPRPPRRGRPPPTRTRRSRPAPRRGSAGAPAAAGRSSGAAPRRDGGGSRPPACRRG